jgi:hypothetical protein
MKGKRATIPDGPGARSNAIRTFKLFNAWVKAEPWDKVHVDELPELGHSWEGSHGINGVEVEVQI